jgi:DNA-binding MarR family transcriptional regulator
MTNNRVFFSHSSQKDGEYSLKFQQFLEEMIKILDDVDPEMPLQRFKTFVYVSMNPGITTKELAEKARISNQSASRNLLALGELNPMTKRSGYCLIASHENFADRRGRRYSLAPRGRDLLEKLENALAVQVKSSCEHE